MSLILLATFSSIYYIKYSINPLFYYNLIVLLKL